MILQFRNAKADQILAQALATPLRKCIVTGARVPVFFQIEFHALNHPKTGAPWFVPDELIQPEAQFNNPTDNIQGKDSHVIKSEAAGVPSTPTKLGKLCSSNKASRFDPLGAGAYMLAHQALLRLVSEKSRKSGEILRFTPRRWKENSNIRTKEVVWREDMDAFVLNMLRRTIVGKLKYLRYRKSGYIVRNREGFDKIQKSKNLGSLLWLGPPSSFSKAVKDLSKEENSKPPDAARTGGPPPFAMADYHGHYVPIYNLRTMLGVELVNALREDSELFGAEVVTLKAKANTVRTQMLLWKLQIYLANTEVS